MLVVRAELKTRGTITWISVLVYSMLTSAALGSSGLAEGAQTWGGGGALFIYTALSAVLRTTSLALAKKCILGWQYNEKLIIPLTSSSTRSANFIVQNSNLNCGFLGGY